MLMLLAKDVANFFVKKIDNIHSQITSMKINASDIALVPPDLMVDENETLFGEYLSQTFVQS